MAAFLVLLAAFLVHGALAVTDPNQVQMLGPQAINLWKLDKLHAQEQAQAFRDYRAEGGAQEPIVAPHFHPRWFEQPLDHFSKSSETWRQRYWVNDRHYKPKSGKAAPVIVIDGGETSGENRLPFLDTGIAEILARATGGIGVVLEHRYVSLNLCTV